MPVSKSDLTGSAHPGGIFSLGTLDRKYAVLTTISHGGVALVIKAHAVALWIHSIEPETIEPTQCGGKSIGN